SALVRSISDFNAFKLRSVKSSSSTALTVILPSTWSLICATNSLNASSISPSMLPVRISLAVNPASISCPSYNVLVMRASPDKDVYIRTNTSYIAISIAHTSTFPPCTAILIASSNANTDFPLPDSPNRVYILPDTYSPIAENFDFHNLNDSPALRRSYSSRNLSAPVLMSVPTLSRTVVLILT